MNSSFTYSVVSYKNIVDLFHAVLFWRYEQKSKQGVQPNYWFLTFDTLWNLLDIGKILPEKRIKVLRGNKELCKMFLKRTAVVEQYDERHWDVLFTDAGFKHFCIRKSNRELTRGNTVNHLELCSRARIYITRFGVREAPSVVESIAHLLDHNQFSALWDAYTATEINETVLGSLMKAKNHRLDSEIWGVQPREV